MELIEKYLDTYFGMPGRDLSSMAQLFEEKTLSKDDFLLKLDQYSQQLCFVKKGFLRMYAYDQSGTKEITHWIASQGGFVVEISSFTFDTPSRFNIQALTDCELYSISKEKYNQIDTLIPNWAMLEKLFLTKCFISMENRIFNQLSMSAEEKYRDLLGQSPEIFNQVPLQYLASMLGMTPETLSRVRRKLIS